MAFQLLRKGFGPDYRCPPRWADKIVVVETRLGGQKIRRRDIAAMFDEYTRAALDIWAGFHRFGLPYSGGWAEQPAVLMDVISAIEEEYHGTEG